jgi:uncharacterized membrane protein
MSLSKEERQILQEMEEALREQDHRAFVKRAKSANLRSSQKIAVSMVLAFIGGFSLLLLTFGSSVLIGTVGFLVMLGSSLVFVKHQGWSGLERHHVAEGRGSPDT